MKADRYLNKTDAIWLIVTSIAYSNVGLKYKVMNSTRFYTGPPHNKDSYI